jgi:uncharacterized protein YndB with AHSA1/START domain
MAIEFKYAIFIGKSAEDIWAAVTQKQIIDRYYLAPLRLLELQAGGRISYGQESDDISGTVLEVDAPKRLKHTFLFGGSTDPESTVTYEIKPIGSSMSLLTITHAGFPNPNEMFTQISGGWPVIASSLKTILETGHGLPWPKQ